MPFAAIPFCTDSISISSIIHHLTGELTGRFEITVVSGKRGRDRGKEIPGVRYRFVESWTDRTLVPAWSALTEWRRGLDRHLMDREVYTPAFAKRAATLLARQGCEIVFLFQFAQWAPVFRRRLPNARIFVWLQSLHNLEEQGEVARRLLAADGAIACSHCVARRVRALLPELEGRVTVVHNGIDPSVFIPPSDRAVREEVLFHSGRLVPYKGIQLLVDAFAILVPSRPNLRLKIAGPFARRVPGSLVHRALISVAASLLAPPGLDSTRSAALSIVHPAFRDEVRTLDRADFRQELLRRAGAAASRIEFLGDLPQAALVELYQRCSIFVHPALWHEAFGMGVLEALACGAPLVTTDCGGPPELVRAANAGKVVEADGEAMAEAIGSMLDDPVQRTLMARRGSAMASTQYTWKRSADRLARLIDEQVQGERRSRRRARPRS